MMSKKRTYLPRILIPPRCENCGNPETLEFFEHIKTGITLCEWCSQKRVKAVIKRKCPPIWVKQGDKYIIPEEAEEHMSNE